MNATRKATHSFRLSDETVRNLRTLAGEHGCSEAEIVTLAIDRMYFVEITMSDKRIIPANDVDPNRPGGLIVDLNNPESATVNPDCYFRFRSRKRAKAFLRLIDSGEDPYIASLKLDN